MLARSGFQTDVRRWSFGRACATGGTAAPPGPSFANDEHAVALYDVTMNRSGATLVTRQIGLFHFANGAITEGWFYDEDPAAVNAFWS